MSSNKSKEIIEELDKQSRDKEEHFFSHIATRLGRERMEHAPDQPLRGVPEFWKSYELSSDARIQLFMKNWEDLGGVAKRFSTNQSLVDYVKDVVTSMGARHLIRANDTLLEELSIDEALPHVEMTVWHKDSQVNLLEKAAGADIGISVVDYAIAHTGTIVVTSSPDKGRSLSLLPTASIAILRSSVIKTRMGEVMKEIHKRNGNGMPAGIHFITGPSRSADIENDLTIGVHGPGIVYALLVD